RQAYDGFVTGKKTPILTEIGRKTLLVIRRIDKQFAADNLPIHGYTGRVVVEWPVVRQLIARIHIGITEQIEVKGDDKGHDASVLLVVAIDIAQFAYGFYR